MKLKKEHEEKLKLKVLFWFQPVNLVLYKEAMMLDRMEKLKDEKPTDAKANELHFGAFVKKFEPPPPPPPGRRK
jgi:hypothetical protein